MLKTEEHLKTQMTKEFFKNYPNNSVCYYVAGHFFITIEDANQYAQQVLQNVETIQKESKKNKA